MKLPFVIIGRKRWEALTRRAARMESAVDGLSRSIADLRGRTDAAARSADELRMEVRRLSRMLNDKQRHGTWQSIGK